MVFMATEAETPSETKDAEPTIKGGAKSTNPQISAGGIVLSTVYHGLFEPLQSISGYIELILDGKVPDPRQRMEFLRISYRESQYLANRFRDLIVASSIETGEFELKLAKYSMETLIRRCIQQLMFKADAKGIHLQDSTSELPTVEGDESLINTAMLDILDTLIKFAPSNSRVTVNAGLEDDQLIVRTTDSGGGMTKEDLAKLGRQSADSSDPRTGATAGLGLGLAIARHIVEAHGGRIWFEEAQGGGSSLNFKLPLKAKVKKIKRPVSTNPKILIVDDEPAFLHVIEYALQHEGYETLKAGNGIKALEFVENEQVDLVILDVMLPGMDGYEVCHRLQAKPQTADIPVLMISAKSRVEDKATAMRVGARLYLEKPFGMGDLISAVKQLLAGTDGQDGDKDGIPIVSE
jgi:CheY-like chemotaxis protein